ncbi:hypothetical protein M6B38_177310 [Iris pallida]|uniref:Uncharacterized protein n=1 Tax=Iris pallida TaxID=29817 RepID=A0AAX6EPX3_IRIPA|nr:hypothetical protein M6B38_177310 [Iris pallida]
MTTRRWAWKQPSFEESVIAYWSSSMAPKMSQGSSDSPKRRDLESFSSVSSRTFCQSGKVFGDNTWRYQKLEC